MPAGIHHHRAADAKMRPEQAAAAVIDSLAVDEGRSSTSCAMPGKLGVKHLRIEHQRHQCGVGGRDGDGQASQRSPSRSHRCRCGAAIGRRWRGSRATALNRSPLASMSETSAAVARRGDVWSRGWPVTMITPSSSQRSQQRVEHRPRGIGDGEEFAGLFAFEFDAERCEPATAAVGIEGGEELRTMFREPLKSSGVTTSWVTLHRPPPETRIFAPSDSAPSRSTIRRVPGGRLRRRRSPRPIPPRRRR